MDLETARFNMIEQQVRPWGVTDSWVLKVLKEVPREAFVPPSQRDLAFADLSLPIGFNETMWQPKIEARLLQAAAPSQADRVLEVGTGSGYLTALLANCAAHVTSIDIHGDFVELARTRLLSNKINNIDLFEGDGAAGWPSENQWDVIMLTGSVPSLPSSYCDILAPNGRLVVIVGQEPVMEAMLLVNQNNGVWESSSLFDTVVRPLVNSERPNAFTF